MPDSLTIRELPAPDRWPHRLAVALVCTTFPLIWIGALVTTENAGMSVPDWPTTYGYNMFAYPLTKWLWGPWDILIEHGHRLLATLVGMLTIAALAVIVRRESRVWLRWFTAMLLVLVCFQGALGGMRVVLDEITLAKLHGCFGPLFFGSCVALACFTSSWWRGETPEKAHEITGRFQALAVMVAAFAYIQLVLGAQLRHVAPAGEVGFFKAAVWGHVLMALVVAGYIYVLATMAVRHLRDQPRLVRPAVLLAVLVTLQLLLGSLSWVVKYSVPAALQSDLTAGWTNTAGSMTSSIVITAHVAIGSLIFVNALMISLRSFRLLKRQAQPTAARAAAMEAAL